MLCLISLIVANQSSLQWNITTHETFLLTPYFFPWPHSDSHFFHSRTSTVTPVQVIRLLGSFTFAGVVGQFMVRLKLLSKWKLFIRLKFKSNVLLKSIASKNIQTDMNYVSKKILSCTGHLGL